MTEEKKIETLSSRNEFLFLYDIKMGNPNGDPDENRPRVLPDNTFFVTDVRLKRFIRDYLKYKKDSNGKNYEILVDTIKGRTTNLTGRVVHYLKQNKQKYAEGEEIVSILLDAFIDTRFFGSSFAFKKIKVKEGEEEKDWEPKPLPKTLTGPIQINMGEVLHEAEEIDIHGTTTFASDEEKSQGTFTEYFCLRYGLIGFSGIANENSAKLSRLTDDDYTVFLEALWKCVRESGNTRTKRGQISHLLINIEYKKNSEFQFGRLQDYVKLLPATNKGEKEWQSPEDYEVDISKLLDKLKMFNSKVKKITYEISDDCNLKQTIPSDWGQMNIDLGNENQKDETE
ncbi:type I-B CRISPR-associated protein Cas7/Csh2 [bacterium]|nr:MAG: type I-B CRISPR-associated protein Cas7/Csh2 [bacterium]